MKKIINQLESEFKKISQKGYIKGIYNCYSSIGRTFETELNLPRNKDGVPDYYGIEIKTRRTYSKSAITLFNAVPNGEAPMEVERLKNTYGYPYKKDKRYKVLYFDAYGDRLTFGGVKYQYKLEINRKKEKIYLYVCDRKGIVIEHKVYWTFCYLQERLLAKLKYLALINAWPKEINGWNYFHYYKIDFYKLKNFNKFLELLEIGIIKVTFKVNIYLDEANYGKTYNHGCGFSIKEKDLLKLFDKLDNSNM